MFFSSSKYKTFQRSLQMWGFEHINSDGPYRNTYFHSFFIRGMQNLCHSMSRMKQTRSHTKTFTRSLQFPWKLHLILDRAKMAGHTNIISWTKSGTSFFVHDEREFSREIMPFFFSSSKYRTFQRSLQMWGFALVSAGPEKGAYFHPSFIQGNPHLCYSMTRVKVKGDKESIYPHQASPQSQQQLSSSWPLREIDNDESTLPQGITSTSRQTLTEAQEHRGIGLPIANLPVTSDNIGFYRGGTGRGSIAARGYLCYNGAWNSSARVFGDFSLSGLSSAFRQPQVSSIPLLFPPLIHRSNMGQNLDMYYPMANCMNQRRNTVALAAVLAESQSKETDKSP